MLKLSLSSPHMNVSIWKNHTGKHESQSKCVVTGPQPCLAISPTLVEAIKITIPNWKFAVSILLPVSLFSSLLVCGENLVLASPSTTDVFPKVSSEGWKTTDVDETTRRVTRLFLGLKLAEWLFSYAIWVLFLVTSISMSSEAYNGRKVSGKGLFSMIVERWKRPVITGFYMSLISISLTLFFSISILMIPGLTQGVLSLALLVAMVILAAFCYLLVASVWMMSLVVSILEDGSCSGLKAIDRAEELIKGKMLRGCAIQLFLVLTGGAIYLVSFIMVRKIRMPMVAMISRIFLICLLQFLMFVVYTVFYHECKRFNEKDVVAAGDEGEALASYAPVASVEV